MPTSYLALWRTRFRVERPINYYQIREAWFVQLLNGTAAWLVAFTYPPSLASNAIYPRSLKPKAVQQAARARLVELRLLLRLLVRESCLLLPRVIIIDRQIPMSTLLAFCL